MSELVLI